MREVFVTASGLAIVKIVREKVVRETADREADELTDGRFAQHDVAFKELSDEWHSIFQEIFGSGDRAADSRVEWPRTWAEDDAIVDKSGRPNVDSPPPKAGAMLILDYGNRSDALVSAGSIP